MLPSTLRRTWLLGTLGAAGVVVFGALVMLERSGRSLY